MSDPVLSAIARQKASCCLFVIREDMKAKGKWRDDLHEPAYQAKTQELEARWK